MALSEEAAFRILDRIAKSHDGSIATTEAAAESGLSPDEARDFVRELNRRGWVDFASDSNTGLVVFLTDAGRAILDGRNPEG